MSRAVMYETFGGPEVLELREVPDPHAGPGEVRVRVIAAGLNPMDSGIASRPEAAARFGYLIIISGPLWDQHIPEESKVTGTLWAVGTIGLASVITAVIGAPFFLFVLMSRRARQDLS